MWVNGLRGQENNSHQFGTSLQFTDGLAQIYIYIYIYVYIYILGGVPKSEVHLHG